MHDGTSITVMTRIEVISENNYGTVLGKTECNCITILPLKFMSNKTSN